jgi:hypothetical protein
MEVHDHFRKANVLHNYVVKAVGESIPYMLETGQELLAAKAAIPHGRWESECERLFDGSLRTAQFYMQFAKNIKAIPKAHGDAVLYIESTVHGAAQAAKKAAGGDTQSTGRRRRKSPPKSDDGAIAPEPPPKDYGKCPNCTGTKWDEDEEGVSCHKCHHPHGEPLGDVDDKQLTIQRSKTVKTVEALMRAFDDLQAMRAKPEHGGAIDGCKALLRTAKAWK